MLIIIYKILTESSSNKGYNPIFSINFYLKTLFKDITILDWGKIPDFDVLCADKIIQSSVKHLLVDLPSVDRESDNGRLAFHHAFWEVPKNPNFERTITEMIFVDDSILDGDYILTFQIAPFENDASPSRPILYEIEQI